MSGGDPGSMLERAVGVCFAVLLGAMALYGTVRLIALIWVPLCIGLCAVAAVIGGWVLLRWWRGW